MNIPSVDIKDMLESDSGLGLSFAENLFIGKEPAIPDNTITIFDTYGFPPQVTLDRVNNYYYPSIQIRIRNNSYKIGLELAQDIVISLHGRAQESWGGVLYTSIRCMSGPALLDYDNNDRPRFIINFDLQRR